MVAVSAMAAEDKPAEPEVKQPVSDNKLLPRAIVKPWKAESFIEYGGVYTALKSGEPGSARLVFTPFVALGGGEQVSVCRISIPDLMGEPVYTVLGSLTCDPKTGVVTGAPLRKDWRMVTYKDPNTGTLVYGVDADGLVYADWSHPPGSKPVETKEQAEAPPPTATPIPVTRAEEKPPEVKHE